MSKSGRVYSAYDKAYQARPSRVKIRVAQNRARRQMIRAGRAKVGDGKDVDHKVPLSKGGSGKLSNLRVISASANRAKKNKSV